MCYAEIALVLFLLLLSGLLALQLYGYWKLRASHRLLRTDISSLERTINSGIGHIEDSLRLSSELKLTRSLPPLRDWAARPDLLLELTHHIQAEQPKVIVECGSGSSTVVLARCVEMNGIGHVYSLEDSSRARHKTRQELARHQLASFATVFTAPLRRYDINGEEWFWYSFEALPQNKIDLLVIDGPPGHTAPLEQDDE